MNTINAIITMVFFSAAMLPAQLSAESPDDIVVFVNKNISIDAISADELKQIFLKKKTRWSGGDQIVCINSPNKSVREQFRQKVLGMSGTEEDTYWQDQKIRGQLSPPVEMSNTPKAVFKINRAVSYALRKDLPEGVVKVVLVIQ